MSNTAKVSGDVSQSSTRFAAHGGSDNHKLIFPDHPNPVPGEITLEQVRESLGDCHRCELGEYRDQLVFGDGNPHAKLFLIGEAPGRNEDKSGNVFVGAAGNKLNAILEQAGLCRDDVYIGNVLKCHPPTNRNPKPAEIAVCAPFLREQIRSVWPMVIVPMGNFATRFILKTDAGITNVRGIPVRLGHFNVVPTYHPAASIYDSKKLPIIEEDFRLVAKILKEREENGE